MQKNRNRGSRHIVIDHLENRRFLSGVTTELVQEPITIGAPGFKTITFVATSGRRTTLSIAFATAAISFPGPAALTVYKGHAFFPTGVVETISSIVIANAIPGKASLKEAGSYGPGRLFDVGSFVGGNLGSINAPDVNLTGSITVSSVQRLTLGSVSSATVNLGASASKVQIAGALSGTVTAGSIGSLSVASISHASITTTDPFSRSKVEIGTIDGGSGILDSNIISAGNIGTVKAGFLQGSVITAATNAPALSPGQFPSAGLPTSSLAIVAPASIGSVKITSKSLLAPAYFLDSVIAADSVRSVELGQINGGGGVAAQRIGGFRAMGPSGSLDRFPFHLGSGELKTAAKAQAALTKLNIPFAPAPGLSTDTVFYNFNLDILT